MDDIFVKIALSKIEEAIKNGEFKNLEGQGKPIKLDSLSTIAPEMRTAYTVLKNSGFVPEEVLLLKEIGELREQLTITPEGKERRVLEKSILETELKYNLMREVLRKKR
ncbi:MAG: hypothetical protein APF84_19295 [Gracilibacter sp. BRH_c7a]|nr:MAG: hypothetical protein APF84_19295 [Gracilibacter sp. BRH_c7a]